MKKSNKKNKPSLVSNKNINKYILPQFNLYNSEVELIKFKNTSKQRAIYKVFNNNQYYSLKKVYYSEKELLFIYSALEWLYRNNLNVPRFLKSTNKSRFAVYNDMIFTLSPWLKGEKCDFDNKDHITMSIEVLALVHKASKNFVPISGSKIKSGYNNLYIQELSHLEELNRISTLCINSKSSFSKCFIKHFKDILFLCESSVKIASSIDLKDLSSSLTHGDFVNKNILIDEKKVSIIDFDKCKYDYTAHDISYFLRRLLKRANTKWDTLLCIYEIKSYNQIEKLTPSDLKYIIAYLCFPQKFYKLSKAYYSKRTYYSTTSKSLQDLHGYYMTREDIEKSFVSSFSLIDNQINFCKQIIKYFESINWNL